MLLFRYSKMESVGDQEASKQERRVLALCNYIRMNAQLGPAKRGHKKRRAGMAGISWPSRMAGRPLSAIKSQRDQGQLFLPLKPP